MGTKASLRLFVDMALERMQPELFGRNHYRADAGRFLTVPSLHFWPNLSTLRCHQRSARHALRHFDGLIVRASRQGRCRIR